jgi:hypothetical protein
MLVPLETKETDSDDLLAAKQGEPQTSKHGKMNHSIFIYEIIPL